MRKSVLLFVFSFLSHVAFANDAMIDALIAQMTLAEKVNLLGGVNHLETKPLPRLGIPAIKMTDGPLGVNFGQATSFPSGLSIGATFDPALAEEFAVAIAEEARFKGRNMLLGPCVNISRNPFGGRNFESYGEDPYLTSRLTERYVSGIQSRGLLASVKHLAANDQEFERMTINANVPVRALFEIHLPAFEAAVNAGSWTVMSAYNRINGHYASENDFLQNTVLKKMWGFKGFVVSDWGATHSVVGAANGGLDLEMPRGDHFNDQLIAAIHGGAVAEYVIDDKVRRILRAMEGIGLIGDAEPAILPPARGPGAHDELNLRIAQESLVLLKNEQSALPLQGLKNVAVIGPNAAVARISGDGSSQVVPYRAGVTPLDGLRSRMGSGVQLHYARGVAAVGDPPAPIAGHLLRPSKDSAENGLLAEYFTNMNLEGAPALTRVEKNVNFRGDSALGPDLQNNMSVRWSGFVLAPHSGTFRFSTLSDDGVRFFVNNKLIISRWDDHGPILDTAEVKLNEGELAEIRLEFYQNGGGITMALGWEPVHTTNEFAEAVEIAKSAEAAVIFAGLGSHMEGEGNDKPSLKMPAGQVELIEAVASVNPRTIVVLTGGNPLELQPWLGKVQAVLHTWYAGQEGGNAIADVLVGNVNPSGKLPITFLKRWEDSPAYGNYPGANGQVNYDEGIFVGYRHFDSKNVEPEFPFGFGLSYTSFELSNLRVVVKNSSFLVPAVEVYADVKNTGSRGGAEVVQLYVGENQPLLPRPVRELKGFEKVRLAPGETKTVMFNLSHRDFAYFDEETMSWKVNPSTFNLNVGTSSRHLPLTSSVQLRK